MAESTLSIVWKEYQARQAVFVGWSRGALYNDSAWSDQQQFELDGWTASGLRRFYFPPILPGESAPYKWSFLRPTAAIPFKQGEQAIRMPDDYGGLEGPISLLTTNVVSQPWAIKWTTEGNIRQMYASTPTFQGPPQLAAPAPIRGTSGQASQRFEVLLYPIADQDYTVQVQYYITPDTLSGAFPYAYGGAAHVETIMESCLSVAEERFDDIPAMQGAHGQAFMMRLAASVAADRTMKPQRLGYNRDRSDDRNAGYYNPHWWGPPATYNGQSFGED